VVDRIFSEPKLAELYDAWCAGRPDFAFYLPIVMEAKSVLDIGCGTGELLRLAREAGHTGRLCGLDPAAAMLDVARRRSDIQWILGEASDMTWEREFDLIVMTGHAFQVLLTDDELRASLTAIRSALTEDGRFVFETRNPLARVWETWSARTEQIEYNGVITEARGTVEAFDGQYLTFTTIMTNPLWESPEVSTSTLRFLDTEKLERFLEDSGLMIEEQFGNWNREALTKTSPEIITAARRAWSPSS
jgi:SAM-dependent methyltransferase